MSKDRIKRASLGLVLLLLVCHGLLLGVCTQDDAFISFRYAHNLIEGHGLVYNVGVRVEGYTNFLWVVLMALLMKAGLDVLLASRLIGMMLSIGIVLLMYEFSRRVLHRESMLGLLGAAFLAVNGAFATEAVQGLETQMFILLAFAGQYFFLREEIELRGFPLSAIFFGLASLTRPEGLLIFGVTVLFRAGVCLAGREKPAARDINRLVVFGLIFLPFFGWRYTYYGFPFPNTYYAKVGWGLAQAWRGARYLGGFLFSVPFVFVSAPLLWLERRALWVRYSFSLVLSYAIYVVAVGGDFKATFRFMLPVLPLVYLWLQESVPLGADFLERTLTARRARHILLAIVAFSLCWTLVSSERARRFAGWRRSVLPLHTAAGEWLRQNVPLDSVLATSTAGVIPYYSGLTTIDMLGLTDLHIAHSEVRHMGSGLAGHEKGDSQYVLDRQPTIILFQNWRFTGRPIRVGKVRPMTRTEAEIWRQKSFRESYQLRSVPLGSFYFNYFQRVND